jgi:hypothetical protein
LEDHADDDHRLRKTLPLNAIDEHIAAAQKAAERRLAVGMAQVWGEEDDVVALELEPPADPGELAGPFCGCDTCIVREVLDAAWPHMIDIKLAAIDELAAKTLYGPDPEPSIRAMAKILKLVRGEG